MRDFVSVLAPAKINLSLDILGKRNDGYHTLRTIMQTVSVFDKISIKPNGLSKTRITCNHHSIPCDKSNLVYIAAVSFFKATDCILDGMDIDIFKGIPSLAGLGGGSSDAAAMIVGLNALMETGLSEKELCNIGTEVGADVPFCIIGSTALCEGIGEIITPVHTIADCYIVIVKPDLNISTPEAFKKYDALKVPQKSEFDDLIASLNGSDIKKTSSLLFNSLEYAIDNPVIGTIKKELLNNGALGALMSGSGSAVYGIFEKKKQAQKCFNLLKDKYPFCEICTPYNKGCEIV